MLRDPGTEINLNTEILIFFQYHTPAIIKIKSKKNKKTFFFDIILTTQTSQDTVRPGDYTTDICKLKSQRNAVKTGIEATGKQLGKDAGSR